MCAKKSAVFCRRCFLLIVLVCGREKIKMAQSFIIHTPICTSPSFYHEVLIQPLLGCALHFCSDVIMFPSLWYPSITAFVH
jgi:hypothetical protein